VTLAFLDSGFYPHPDLTRPENRILRYADATGAEIIENTSFNRPHRTSWHGLMTSCLAAGSGFKSGHLYRGIAPCVNLVFVKTGHRGGRGINEDDIQRALGWVVANQQRFNIRVVNISLGGDHPVSKRLCELDSLVEEAVARGMVVVAAAGRWGAAACPPASAPRRSRSAGWMTGIRSSVPSGACTTRITGSAQLHRPKPEVIAGYVAGRADAAAPGFTTRQGRLFRLDRIVERMYRRLETAHSGTLPGNSRNPRARKDAPPDPPA
jgi:hypothetical protein